MQWMRDLAMTVMMAALMGLALQGCGDDQSGSSTAETPRGGSTPTQESTPADSSTGDPSLGTTVASGGGDRWTPSEESCERWGDLVGEVIYGTSNGGFSTPPFFQDSDATGCRYTVTLNPFDLSIGTSVLTQMSLHNVDPDNREFQEDNPDVVLFDVPGADVAYWNEYRNPDGTLLVYGAGMHIDGTWVVVATHGNANQAELLGTKEQGQQALTLLAQGA